MEYFVERELAKEIEVLEIKPDLVEPLHSP
jgi:hypothetical protein